MAWVRVGSDSELYRFWRRDDVCRVGEHVAAGVQAYLVLAGGPLWNRVYLEIKACPAHAGELRRGWCGWPLASRCSLGWQLTALRNRVRAWLGRPWHPP